MDDTQAAKVLRFPGKHKESSEAMSRPAGETTSVGRPTRGVGVALLAIALGTIAVNRYAARAPASDGGRAVASVSDRLELKRDAGWEKSVAERLARTSVNVHARLGRDATPGENLRFGVLEDRYVIAWLTAAPGGPRIRAITLGEAEPLRLDGARVFARFGQLFAADFARARLAHVDQGPAGGRETFELVNGAGDVVARATLAFDSERRLLSVTNAPVQI